MLGVYLAPGRSWRLPRMNSGYHLAISRGSSAAYAEPTSSGMTRHEVSSLQILTWKRIGLRNLLTRCWALARRTVATHPVRTWRLPTRLLSSRAHSTESAAHSQNERCG